MSESLTPGTQATHGGRNDLWSRAFERNVASQSGEDGILEKVLELFPERNRWCVEFGAWDGRQYSNTFNLLKHHGYSAVLVEADRTRFEELQRHCQDFPKCIPIHALVGFGEWNNLDVLLRGVPIPDDFDLLSIDIDGNDYHVWAAIRRFRPKAVIVEFNPTIPTAVDFVQPPDAKLNQGASLKALNRLAQSKEYELVATTRMNAIFVDRKYFPLFKIADNSPEALRSDESGVTHIFSGYDGTVFIRGAGQLAWHRLPYRESRMQLLPQWLREYPGNYPAWKRVLAKLYRSLVKRGIL